MYEYTVMFICDVAAYRVFVFVLFLVQEDDLRIEICRGIIRVLM